MTSRRSSGSITSTAVVVSLSDARGKLPMDKLLEMKLDGVSFEHLASVYEKYTGKIAVENLRPSWLIFSPGFRKSHFLRVAKRGLDVAVSLAGLVLGAPLMVLVAAAVRCTSPGPVLYRQERVGLRGRIIPGREVPLDAAGRGEGHRGGVGDQGRHTCHAGGRVPAPLTSGRTAAALERSARRHELRRAASRASRVRVVA